MTLGVAKLKVEERVRFDPGQLEALCHDLGEEGAEQAIAQGLEQIAFAVAQLDTLGQAQDMQEIAIC